LRLACLKRDRFLCQLHLSGCQVRASIADHIVERKAGGADTLHNLRGVCVSCHAKRHPEKGGFDA
jgi:5-methylcytosine-specific restriction enzyme A